MKKYKLEVYNDYCKMGGFLDKTFRSDSLEYLYKKWESYKITRAYYPKFIDNETNKELVVYKEYGEIVAKNYEDEYGEEGV